MRAAVFLLNFGEPEDPTPDEVIPFLERIFALNAPLMGSATPPEVHERIERMAAERAPALIAEYEMIGGSPLHRQASAQSDLLEATLRRRGRDVVACLGMQFTRPSIGAAVARARELGAERAVGLPVYPITGPTTTFAALDELRTQIQASGWETEVLEITGWHRSPAYVRLRADAIRRTLVNAGATLGDPRTKLVFSAHGTPIRYLEEGSRYDVHVRELCARLAHEVGASAYALGYQNHSNRPGVRWTQPDTTALIQEIEARRVIVDPISFMHEQSETLADIDHELRAHAEARGIEFHRVPIPFDDPAFIDLLADLVERRLDEPPMQVPDPRAGKRAREADSPGILRIV